MDELDKFIENLNQRNDFEYQEKLNIEKSRDAKLYKLSDRLSSLKAELHESRQTIDKNLCSITSCKHSIKKAKESVKETGLPISNVHHEKFIDFVSKVMNFANVVADNHNFASENITDEFGLVTSIKSRNENMMEEIRKNKNMIEEMQTLMDNIYIASSENVVGKEDNSDLESSILNELEL